MPEGLRCIYLEVVGKPGDPGATRCKIHDERRRGLPILLMTPEGLVGSLGVCAHGTSVDDEVIIPYIGKGCSLEVVR
jgi:hypothetical protein